MDSTDMELECDGSCEASKIVRDEDTDSKRKTIDVDLDSYGREDVPNPPKIRKNVKQSMNHKGDTIGKTIEKNLKDWGIERVMTLTVDNASSNDTAVAYLLKRFNKGSLFGGIRYAVRFIRWNSTYMMLEAAVKFEKAFDRLEDEDASYRHDMSPNKEDWTNARIRLFHEYSTTRSGSRQGCSSTSTTSTQTVSGLDANIDFDSNENVGEDFVYDTIVEEFEDDSTTPFEQGSSKIDIYLLEANVRTEGDFDILQWWKMNSDRFEVLGQMARDILAIPISTVASESAFSTGGRVVDSSRCSLAPKTVEALICTQNWLNSDPIHLQFQHELEEASKFEEGFRVVMENEKELEDLSDFDKLSITDY
ncbi:zinc finger BED domain-containing protein RICESLEEPER 2-like [Cucumis melo var. makuwa]|uniref:Zinc finger BED domain-containing protein RICESLEEPER 2-like n=1 Tax=Cucumis melo var. makuwa TaxID=1194695 RepID=A0A5A7USY1_CUCMM|nr:zinc finger BED domain-containing protein RICESLEEPER 2-like [Cucumis melo var. makuwa]